MKCHLLHSGLFAVIFSMLTTAGVSAAEVDFVDHRGVAIKLPSPPQKVVTIVRSGPIIYRAIDGTTEHISAVNQSFYKRDFVSGQYAVTVPELGDLASTAAREGFVPNVEEILKIKPDAIIQWTYDPKIIEPLERVGLTVVGWDCCTAEHRRDYLTMVGQLTGNVQQAEKILQMQDNSATAMRREFSDVPKEELVSVLHIDQLGDQIRVIANGSLDLSLSGVSNPSADDSGKWWKTVDLEQLFNWNPEMIVIPPYAKNLTPETFFKNPLLAGLKAVKNKRIYKIPAFAGSPDAPEKYLESPWLAAVAHRKEVPEFRTEIQTAYKSIYGVDLNKMQVDKILWVQDNSSSQGYLANFK